MSDQSQHIVSLAESMWESYTLQYALLCKVGNGRSIATEMMRSRGKLGYLFPMLETQRRIRCFYDLAKYGKEEDMEPLQKIVDDSDLSDEIRNSAKYAIDAIDIRVHKIYLI